MSESLIFIILCNSVKRQKWRLYQPITCLRVSKCSKMADGKPVIIFLRVMIRRIFRSVIRLDNIKQLWPIRTLFTKPDVILSRHLLARNLKEESERNFLPCGGRQHGVSTQQNSRILSHKCLATLNKKYHFIYSQNSKLKKVFR